VKRLAILATATLAACTEPAKPKETELPPPPAAKRSIEVLVTGDLGSDTQECGCKAREMGGVARRAKVIRDRERAGTTLVLDAGDHFFRTPLVSPRDEAQAKETARFLASTLRSMKVAAIAVGERDLAFGLPLLRSLAKESGAALLSANLVFTASSTRAFDAFAIFERGGAKIGVVGAGLEIDPKAAAHPVYAQSGLTAKPLEPALIEAAKNARAAGATFVIALLHTGDQRAREVLARLPAQTIDLAFTAHDRRASQGLELVGAGPSAMVSSGERGKWIASVGIDLVPGAQGIVNAGAIDGAKRSIAELDARIAVYEREDAGVANDDRRATIDRLRRRRTAMEAELAQVSTQSRHALRYELITLDVALPEDPDVLAAFDAFKDRLKVVNAGVRPLLPGEMTYTGNASCKPCHEEELAHWKTTGHARAWATMVQTRQTANLDCIPCHTTGFDRPGGPQAIVGLEPFIDVGCESCHGPGSAHVRNPRVALDHGKKVPERVCAECHRAQADQKPFDFEERLPKVLGKGHGR
jgi:2',3'-cyclic-nucleotide 2'-phosphodiesterase (5'-nucleotidase family)